MDAFYITRRLRLLACFLLGSIFLSAPVYANERVVLQLKWFHQFQFAGYYAAKELGFYEDRGLDVEIRQRDPKVSHFQEVVNGEAQYGVADSSLLLHRLNGEPVVLLSAIYQHSPLVLMTLDKNNIRGPFELRDKRVMWQKGVDGAAIEAMFHELDIPLDSLEFIPHTFDDDALLNGEVDAMSAYSTNQPFYYQKKGFDVHIIDPLSYGIDFYGDVLFTTEKELNEHPERARAFAEASVLGWRYALKNTEEVIDLILEKYSPKSGRELLEFEAKMTKKMVLPDSVDVGNISEARLRHIAETYKSIGLAPADASLGDFIALDLLDKRDDQDWVKYLFAVMFLVAIGIGVLWVMNMRLRRLVAERTRELERISMTDYLTEIYNRGGFMEFAQLLLDNSERQNQPFAILLMDLDYFKRINDEHGHDVGDHVLKEFAREVSTRVRDADVFARFGGEEFIMACHGQNEHGALTLAEQLRSSVIAHDFGANLEPTISIGVALGQKGETLSDIIKKADKALYESKATGRNRVSLYRDPLDV